MTQPAPEPDWIDPTPWAADPSSRPSAAVALLKTGRPKQWVKNVLVFAAPGAAGVIGHPRALARTALMFVLFCATSSGTYMINDALDAEADRRHPLKRLRPIAAGQISPTSAWVAGGSLIVAGVGLGGVLSARSVLVLGIYVIVTLAYSFRLKREPVLEMGLLATGFILRAVAGGVAAEVPLSDWFLIVASFGSLFMVGGKRYAEYQSLGEDRSEHRVALGHYSLSYLRYVRSLSSAVTVAGYCLWAFEKASPGGQTGPGSIWFELSIAPFVIALLRYSLILDNGGGGAPEDVILSDRMIQLMGVVWVGLFALGVYGVAG